MIKYCILAIVSALIALIIHEKNKEIASLLMVYTSIVLGYYILQKLYELTGFLKYLANNLNICDEYIGILIKMLGIAYISELVIGILKDCKQEAISQQIEIIARILMVSLSFPVIKSLITIIGEFLSNGFTR